MHDPHFVDHDSAGRLQWIEGFKKGIIDLHYGFPDFYATAEDIVIEPETVKVAVRWKATGTHQGTYLKIQPTGKHIAFKGIEIIRIQNDLIIERWGEWDGIDLLQQLGGLKK